MPSIRLLRGSCKITLKSPIRLARFMAAIRKGFSTVMLGKETIELIKQAALEKEFLWQTTDRIVKEYLVARLKK